MARHFRECCILEVAVKMSVFNKFFVFFIAAIYLAILNVIYNPYSVWLSIFIICITYALLIFKIQKLTLLFPFFLYPFMFLLRDQDTANKLLTIIPDVSVLAAILIYLIRNKFKLTKKLHLIIMSIYAAVTFIIAMVHVGQIHFFPIILRQYLLPICFLVIFVDASYRSPKLPADAMKISVVSFAIVGILSLLNFFNIWIINGTIEELYPYLNYISDVQLIDNSKAIARSNEFLLLPRINLFSGGSYGSSAALLFTLGLLPFVATRIVFNWKYRFASFVLIVTSLMTFSVSIFISIAALLFIALMTNKYKIIIFLVLIVTIYSLLNISVFVGKSPLAYLNDTSINGVIAYFEQLDFVSFMFGSGPSLHSVGYEFEPELFITDVGIVRVFTELGFASFFIFLLFLLLVFRRGLLALFNIYEEDGREYLLLLIVFILLIHGNITAQPPFFPLFSACVAGILSREVRKKSFRSETGSI